MSVFRLHYLFGRGVTRFISRNPNSFSIIIFCVCVRSALSRTTKKKGGASYDYLIWGVATLKVRDSKQRLEGKYRGRAAQRKQKVTAYY